MSGEIQKIDVEKIQALVEKWRFHAKWDRIMSMERTTYRTCADELEAELSRIESTL